MDARMRQVISEKRHGVAIRFVGRLTVCLLLLSPMSCTKAQDEAHRKLAEEYARKGQIQFALAELGSIQAPTSDDLCGRGELLIRLGRPQFENAVRAFQEALRLDERSARALYGLGLLAATRADFVEAEAFFRKALAIQPGAVHAQNALAGALDYQGKSVEAERLYLALEQDPTVGTLARGNLGELYLRQGKLDLAETKLKEALASMPENFDWHRYLGEVYRLRGQREAAASEYRKALELVRRSPAADGALVEEFSNRVRELEQ